ncbi:MAG TPA: DUF952 domain-containing protein [Pyrinomonadaceae bacterium]|jgi:uncharacterized protein (DUF952 family)|nr:DUF952 domain-containing protein [Pyrinomonadaceae bacterium]
MAIIFHITTREAFAKRQATYAPELFSVEGFIHCSTSDQVVKVADARFRGQTGLVLLCIDTDKVKPEIRYENLEGGPELFPHIYGELNTDAVVQIAEFAPGADGYFALPAVMQTNSLSK